MIQTRCPHAFRRGSDGQVHCKKLGTKPWDYCGNVYFCRVSRQWELTPKAAQCPLSKKDETEKGR